MAKMDTLADLRNSKGVGQLFIPQHLRKRIYVFKGVNDTNSAIVACLAMQVDNRWIYVSGANERWELDTKITLLVTLP